MSNIFEKYGLKVVVNDLVPKGSFFIMSNPDEDFTMKLESEPNKHPGETKDEKIARLLAEGGYVVMCKVDADALPK